MNDHTVECVGIIMDGNRRWAKERGKPSLEGHRAGADTLVEIAKHARDLKIPHLVVYAFSTENWNRTPEEVKYLMELFGHFIDDSLQKLTKERIRVRFIGERERFSKDLQEGMKRLESLETEHDTTLYVALSYGGRAEIVAATNKLLQEKRTSVTEADVSAALWSHPMPDPDIIIRTGGDFRVSGFLPWQSIYSELFFVPTLWPDFSKSELEGILEEFGVRERRHGK